MGKNNKWKDELKALIKRFEEQVLKDSYGFYSTEEFEAIIHHYEQQGKYKKALQACSAGISQYPYSTELLFEKAQILSNLEQYGESLEILDRLNTLQPNDPEILLMTASVLALKGDFETAIETYLYAEPFIQEKDELYYNIGLTYQNFFNYEEAITYYQKAVDININHENALYELAYCLDITGRLEHSISYYKKFIDKDPFSQHAWYNLGIVYSKLDKKEKAIEAYEYAILIDDQFASAWYNLGNAWMEDNQLSKAIDAFRKTIELEGPGAETYCSLAEAYEKLEHLDLAVKYYQKAINLDKHYDEAWFGVGRCMSIQGKWHEAIHFLNRALRLDAENPLYWKLMAMAEYQTGNILSSIDAYEEANMLDPGDKEISLDWSFIYYEQGDYGKALDIIYQAIEELPEESELYYRATAYLIEAGKYKEAFNYLENALVLNFDNHKSLLEFFPKLETQKALFKVINQFKPIK